MTLPADPPAKDANYDTAQLANVATAMRDLRHPKQIGPYSVQQVIGEGGMGTVYRALQLEPIHRTVAIKIIKLGMDTRQVIARFDAERQALALMNHTNVAKVLDAGATESGRPYFVMEYFKGEPITIYADRHKLTLKERLELFMQACDAVQHAHHKAIIHRDLKPTNILVTEEENKPLVKVIDFGVAKALSQRLTEKTLFTTTGQLVGTPEYMSPEQAESAAPDVDTRTDVYSLGVVFYELLSGGLPFDATTLRSAGYNEIQRIIREVDPPRPSTRLTRLGASAEEVARCRNVELDSLTKQLKRELEWIPLKAMRKERAQRYASPTELADDVRNYLNHRPLRAGPESTGYRARKFLRRNKRGVAALAAMVLLLIAGIVTTTWQAIRATRAEARALAERDTMKATLEFLTNDVMAGATPDNIPDAKVRDQIVAAMITPAAARVDKAFVARPLAEAGVREAIQSVLLEIGRSDLALPHAEAALALRRRTLGDNHPDTLTSLNDYGRVLRSLSRLTDAEPVYRECLERRRRALGEEHPDTLSSLNNYAGLLERLRRFDEAEPLLRLALESRRRVLGNEHKDTITSLNNYAFVLCSLKRFEEGEKVYREALELRLRAQGPDHPLTLMAMNNVAYAMRIQGRAAEAEPLYKKTVDAYVRVMGADHPATLTAMNNHAVALRKLERNEEAAAIQLHVLQRRRSTLGMEHFDTILSTDEFALTLIALGRPHEAEPLAREATAAALRNPDYGPTHTVTRNCVRTHADALDALGRRDEAAALRKKFNMTPATATAPATQPK